MKININGVTLEISIDEFIELNNRLSENNILSNFGIQPIVPAFTKDFLKKEEEE